MLDIVKNDPWLEPFNSIITSRHNGYLNKEKELTQNDKISLSEFASGHDYYGLHKTPKEWILREWAPNATNIYLIGEFNDWTRTESYKFEKKDNGNWELRLPLDKLKHLYIYKLLVQWDGGEGERIPAWCRRVVQDPNTHIFSAQVWDPKQKYKFKIKNFKPDNSPLLIYESHVGMSTNDE